MTQAAVIDATDETFDELVIGASHQRPVVVDFWAPWCGPCRMLGPLIERVAAEHGDAVQLVKVNTDENPGVAQLFSIQSIPAVKAFRDGRVVSEFLGAQGEPQVRAFFQGLVPSAADRLAEAGAIALRAQDLADARQHFEAALAADPVHGRALGGLMAVLIEQGDLDGAAALAARAPGTPQVKRQLARLRFERGAVDTDEDALAARLADDEDDVDAHYRLGCHHGRRGEWADALERFLTVVQLDRRYQDDAGRLAALDIFEVLGPDHPLTQAYRPRLGMLLF